LRGLDWKQFFSSIKVDKDDFRVSFFCSAPPGGPEVSQEVRDHVYRAAVFFSGRSKRDSCPSHAAVTAQLDIRCRGFSENMSAEDPVRMVFLSAKQIFHMCHYLHAVRASLLHNVIVYIAADGSGFHPVL
jgi:hypothetical protein